MGGNNWVLILCMFATLSACVDSQRDLEEYVAQVKKNAKVKLEPVEPPTEIKNAQYSAENLRSPFVLSGGSYSSAPVVATGPSGEVIQQQPRPDLDRPREYLEQFPLATLLMVGTLSKPEMNWGLIRDPNNMIHAVKVGDYLGENSGKIIAITPDQIRLTELITNGSGGWMQSRAALTLVPATEAVVQTPASKPVGVQTQNQPAKQPQQSQQPQETQQPTPRAGVGGKL